MHAGLAILISLVLCNIGPIITETIRWTDHAQGLSMALFLLPLSTLGFCFYLFPWSLAIVVLYRWRRWNRFRTGWLLAPAVLVLGGFLVSLLVFPPTPAARLWRYARTELPRNATNLHYFFRGGGFADYSDTYFFATTADEVDRMVKEMNLHKSFVYEVDNRFHSPIEALPGCPDGNSWKNAELYQGHNDDGWFFYLLTDSSRTQVYILTGCI